MCVYTQKWHIHIYIDIYTYMHTCMHVHADGSCLLTILVSQQMAIAEILPHFQIATKCKSQVLLQVAQRSRRNIAKTSQRFLAAQKRDCSVPAFFKSQHFRDAKLTTVNEPTRHARCKMANRRFACRVSFGCARATAHCKIVPTGTSAFKAN